MNDSTPNNNRSRLTNYRFDELRCDLAEIKLKNENILKTLAKFGERIGRAESRVDTLYWLIGISTPAAIALTGLVVSLISR